MVHFICVLPLFKSRCFNQASNRYFEENNGELPRWKKI